MTRLVWTLPDGQQTARWVEDEGGGSQPERNIGQATYSFTGVTVPSDTLTVMSFGFDQGDEAMLDVTDPSLLLPVRAGVYAVSLYVTPSNQTGGWLAQLTLDYDWFTVALRDGADGTETFSNRATVSGTWYSDAGSGIKAAIHAENQDDFDGTLYVQQITGLP